MILVLAAIFWFIVLTATLIWRRPLWRDWIVIGLIGAGTAGFFWRLVFTTNVWMPAGGGDLAQFLYPTYSFAAAWWRRGVMPLWNPYLFAGAPFVGDAQSGIFYPLNLLTFFLSSPLTFRDLELLSILHFFIAGAGMYAFLRWGRWRECKGEGEHLAGNREEFGEPRGGKTESETGGIAGEQLSMAAALFGAVAFEFSDLFVTHFGNLNLIAVAAWMPLVLLFYRRGVTDRRPSLAAVGGVFLAIAFFAGHPQAFLFIVMTLVLLAIWEMTERKKPKGRGAEEQRSDTARPNLQAAISERSGDPGHLAGSNRSNAVDWAQSAAYPLLLLVLLGVVAFGLSAPTLLPGIEMSQHTVRAEFSYEQAADYSLPPAELIGLVVPSFFGRGPQNAWAPWPRVEVGYLGILPLLLVLLALILRRDRPTRAFGLLALIGLGLALGGYGILHGWLYQFVPGFGQLRAPARFIYLFDFALAVLAAFGFEEMLHTLPRASEIRFKRFVRAAPWAFGIIAATAGATTYVILILGQGQDPVLFERMANAANGMALFILLLALSVALILARATRYFHRRTWAILALALVFFDLYSLGANVDVSTEDPTRAYSHPEAVAFLQGNAGLSRIDARGTGVDSAWPADASILHGLYDINGDNPLVLADFDRYWQSLGSRSTALYDLLNIRYLIGRKGVPLDRTKFQLAYGGDPSFDIFENVQALPRALLVSKVVAVGQGQALDAIHANGFDPAQTAVVEGKNPLDSSSPTAVGTGRGTGGHARIVGYGPNEIVVETSAEQAGILVLSEVFYPGWRAWVDDREVSVLRTDFLFRGVAVPAGTHRVRFVYDPGSFKMGEALLAITVLGLIGWGVWSKRR